MLVIPAKMFRLDIEFYGFVLVAIMLLLCETEGEIITHENVTTGKLCKTTHSLNYCS